MPSLPYNRDMNKTTFLRSLEMTEPEEAVLVKMATYFMDMGWIDDSSETAFDSLVEKICEPAPWDYDPVEVKS